MKCKRAVVCNILFRSVLHGLLCALFYDLTSVFYSVSFFPKLYRYDSEELSLEEVIILIRTRRWRKEITAYREQLAAGNKELAGSLKKALPGFTPSGVFSGGHKAAQLQGYNQVVGLDFDDVADLASFASQVMALPTTLGFFVSPLHLPDLPGA